MVAALWQHVNPMCYGVSRVYGTGEVGNISNFASYVFFVWRNLMGYGFGCPL